MYEVLAGAESIFFPTFAGGTLFGRVTTKDKVAQEGALKAVITVLSLT